MVLNSRTFFSRSRDLWVILFPRRSLVEARGPAPDRMFSNRSSAFLPSKSGWRALPPDGPKKSPIQAETGYVATVRSHRSAARR